MSGLDGTRSFGGLLRGHRLAAELTQEALAERAAISTQAVSALERGARRFPTGTRSTASPRRSVCPATPGGS